MKKIFWDHIETGVGKFGFFPGHLSAYTGYGPCKEQAPVLSMAYSSCKRWFWKGVRMEIYRIPFYLFLPLVCWAGLVDERDRRIPNSIILAGLTLFGLSSLVFALTSGLGPPFLSPEEYASLWLEHLAWGVGAFLFLLIFVLLFKGGMGMGDVKLIATLFLFLASAGLTVLAMALGLTMVRFLWLRLWKKSRSPLPFAGSLFLACLVFLILVHCL